MDDWRKLQAKMDGQIPSWYNKENNSDEYITNYGTMSLIKDTSEVKYACIGLGKNRHNRHMTVRINKEEFQVTECRDFGNEISEMSSSGYPYKRKDLSSLSTMEVLEMLLNDDNFNQAAMLTKKALIKLMINQLKLNRKETQAIRELFSMWRVPVVTERCPIITDKRGK